MTENKDTLFALVMQSQELINQLIVSHGEITPELETSLSVIDAKLPAKVDAYAVVLERLEFESEYWKEKARLYSNISKGLDRAHERVKDALKIAAEQLGTDELLGVDVRFKISNTKPSLEIDPALLPDTYLTQTVSFKPDNDKIRSELSAGNEIPGAKLIESKSIRTFPNSKGGKK